MNTLRLLLCDQLTASIASLDQIDSSDTVLICELMEEATYVKHHPKKIAFWFASMRHFAQELRDKNIAVRYVKLTDTDNTQNLTSEVERAVKELRSKNIIVTEPSEYRLKVLIESLGKTLKIPVQILTDNRFLCSNAEFKQWAQDRKQLRMEYFYREMRLKHNILIESEGYPTGGQWNYDKENRKSPPLHMTSPKRISHKKSTILKDVLKMVKEKFSDHFGDLEPFHYAVTRMQALLELNQFIKDILPNFGDYQDAMVKEEAYLNHSLLASYINVGLLLPLEVCQEAEQAYHQGKAPLNAVEGFIRQILGWREYVRGIYWLKMPSYAELNYLGAHTPLPSFYWGGKTKMACIAEAVNHTRVHAYSHHIQRLMITGNFALIAGLDVKEVQKWYLEVYSDAFEWVEMPNTLGMALFGDGGILGSKPYAASGKYIDKMSNFCKGCRYDPKEMFGDAACPYNSLYWDFINRNRSKLEGNHRLAFVFKTWDKFNAEKKTAITKKADEVLQLMNKGEL